MNKVKLINVVNNLYFTGALAGSFLHLVHAGYKLGSGTESWAWPFMIDGIALTGLTMRSKEFASHTQRFGLKMQVGAGALSLAGNVFAEWGTLGSVIFGIAIVALWQLIEVAKTMVESAESENARKAAAEAERIVAEAQAAAEAKKLAAIEKGRRTRAANARTRKAEQKALEGMLAR